MVHTPPLAAHAGPGRDTAVEIQAAMPASSAAYRRTSAAHMPTSEHRDGSQSARAPGGGMQGIGKKIPKPVSGQGSAAGFMTYRDRHLFPPIQDTGIAQAKPRGTALKAPSITKVGSY